MSKFRHALQRDNLRKKCEKITGCKYDVCVSRGHWHYAECYNFENNIGHRVYFSKTKPYFEVIEFKDIERYGRVE